MSKLMNGRFEFFPMKLRLSSLLFGALPLCALACTSTDAQQTLPAKTVRLQSAQEIVGGAVQTEFDKRGLVRLSYKGMTLTDIDANGTQGFAVVDVHRLGADGQIVRDGQTDPPRSWDAVSKTLTLTYPWGLVKCRYQTLADRLNLDITVENKGTSTIAGLNIFPLGVQFKAFPRGFDGATPHVGFNLDGPTVQSADFGAGRLTVVNRGVNKPLAVGFMTSNATPKNFAYGIYVGSAPLWYQPHNWPSFTRPIPTGGSDSYQISLRFSPAEADSAGADVYRDFGAAHSMTLSWPDRRPIGALFLSSAGAHPANNPRGWFNNAPDVDVNSAAGRAQLRERVLAYAASSIAQLRAVGAQGAVTWDIEGQEFPHSTSYIGDPRLLPRLAPEMEPLANDYFRAFTDAGFKVGICVRPQQLKFGADGKPSQRAVDDEAAVLIDKIEYARKRWGATLIYVDSNGGPYDPSDAEIFGRVAAACPDVLLMPEHQNFRYQLYTAPYNDLRFERATTPGAARALYPRAFSVIKVENPQLEQRRDDLVRAVREGDVLMFNAWYETAEAREVKSIYEEAARAKN